MAFGEARNIIIHGGRLPDLTYSGPNCAYNGPFFFTGEFLLRGVIKVLLSELGYDNAWRSELRRDIEAAWEKIVGRLESLNVGLISLHESIDTSQIEEDVNYDQIVR